MLYVQGTGRARVGQRELPEGIGGLRGPGRQLGRADRLSISPSVGRDWGRYGFPSTH